MRVAGIILIVICVLILIVILRTLQFKPKQLGVLEAESITLNQEKIVTDI